VHDALGQDPLALRVDISRLHAWADPVADDLTSLMLYVLVGQEGYSCASPNLFLPDVEASGSTE